MNKGKINIKAIAISVIVVIVLFTIYGLCLFVNKENYNGSLKVSDKITENKRYKNLNITNIKVFRSDRVYHISFDVNNDSEENFKEQSIKLVFLDENKNVLKKKEVIIPSTNIGKKNLVDVVVDKDIINSNNMVISDR